MTQRASPFLSAAEVAFLERCHDDLDAFFVPRTTSSRSSRGGPDGAVELVAGAGVTGRPATITAHGETIVEAYAHLRLAAPDERLALAFRALMDEHAGP